jgi:hypothetical protein
MDAYIKYFKDNNGRVSIKEFSDHWNNAKLLYALTQAKIVKLDGVDILLIELQS